MKSSPVMLTAALVLCLSGNALVQVAAASQDLRPPDNVTPTTPASQDLRSPDSVTPTAPAAPASHDLRSPDSVTPTQNTVAAAAASSDVTLPADGGLGMFLIALISFGGAVALAGAAYGLRRLSHAHAGPPMA
jgi:hypothetical protein